MAATTPRRGHQLLVQGVATAVTALLIAGGAAWAGAPADDATTQAEATETGEDNVNAAKGPRPDTAEKAAKARKAAKAQKDKGPKAGTAKALGQGNGHGKRVSAAARGETPPVGNCRNHGHWVSTVAKGLQSCNDNPRPGTPDND